MNALIAEIENEILFHGNNLKLHFEVNYEVLKLLHVQCNLIQRGYDIEDTLCGIKLKFCNKSKGLELHNAWKVIALWELCEKTKRLYRFKSGTDQY